MASRDTVIDCAYNDGRKRENLEENETHTRYGPDQTHDERDEDTLHWVLK